LGNFPVQAREKVGKRGQTRKSPSKPNDECRMMNDEKEKVIKSKGL